MPCCSAEVVPPAPLLGEPGTWSDWSSHPALEHYQPIAVLGQGAFSKVYRGRCRASGDHVAIKVVFRNKPKVTSAHWPVLRNEVLMLSKLNHPNIVGLQEFFEDNRQLVMILELLDGGEVFEELMAIRKYSEKEAAKLFRGMLRGLEHMHSKGIAHRDIKPENIILNTPPSATASGGGDDDDGSAIKLIDLGMACDLSAACNAPVGALGTIGFVAPEVCMLLPHTPAMDIWSMGILLYIMLCGVQPYTNHQMETMAYVNIPFRMSPGYAHENFGSLSFSARDIILRMLSHNPEKRATAKELLHHVWLTQSPSNAPDKPLPQVCEGAKQIAAYRSRRGMANCVVAPSPAPGSVAGSSSESMAMLLAELEDETTVSNRVLTFDPLDFQANFHDDGHQALASHPGDRRRRRRSSNSDNSGRSWTDVIASTLSNKTLDSLLRGKSTMQQRLRLQSVDEDASVAFLDFHCGTHGVQEKGVRTSASMQRPRARPWQPEPGATSGSEPSEPLNKRVLLRKTSSARQ